MEVSKSLSEEYIMAIKWLKNENLDIDTMNSIEKIIFFNLWIISYFILRYRNSDYLELYKYSHNINSFICFVKNIDNINKSYPDIIYNLLYNNILSYTFDLKEYKFCLMLLKKTKYDYKYLKIVEDFFKKDIFYNNDCNILNLIIRQHLYKYFKNKKYIE